MVTKKLVLVIIGVNFFCFFRVGFSTPICVSCYYTDYELFEILFFNEKVNKSFFEAILRLCIDYLLAAQFVQEGTVGEETIFIFTTGQFIQKLGTILLGNFITHKRQESFKFSQHHGSIFIFVVQFAQLNVVMIVSSVFWLLDCLLDEGYNLVKFAVFLLNIVSLSIFDSGFLGEVHAKSIEDVHEVVHVKFALAMPIVDIADPSNFISIDRHVELTFFDLSENFQNSYRL